MKNINDYLNMQKKQMDSSAKNWSIETDIVVGSYRAHNNWTDYDEYLFKDFDTTNLKAIEYGCGPGRNIIRFNNRFKQIDGTDISVECINAANKNLKQNKIKNSLLTVCDGKSIPAEDESYDVVFSVICLQHIPSYDIRLSILKEAYRVLKKGGHLCFQMGIGERPFVTSSYYENAFDAKGTNAQHDVRIGHESFLVLDLVDIIGFKNYKSDIRPTGPGCGHQNWIWVQVEK